MRDNQAFLEESKLDDSGVNAAKEHLIKAIFQTENQVSLLLSDVAEMIARDSFNKNWSNFISEFKAEMADHNPIKYQKVFRTLSPVFVKIRNMYRSDELYTQINYTIDNFGIQMTTAAQVSNLLILPLF